MNRLAGRVHRSLVVSVFALGLTGWLGSSAVATWRLTARPVPEHEERLPSWLPAELVRLTTRDGLALGVWFHPGLPGEPVASCSGVAELAVLDGRDHQGLWNLDERHWEQWRGLLERARPASESERD
jgi:hypothetical protein